MFLRALDLTAALRPELLPDESLLFVQDAVGLYQGKYKLPDQQNGSVYLTSHRICYVDNAEPRQHSTALELRDVERYEFYAGFLKSSAKITLYPKPSKRSSLQPRPQKLLDSGVPGSPIRSSTASPAPRYGTPIGRQNVTWVCTICSFSNPLPPGFDPTTVTSQTPVQPCQTCGVEPSMAHLMKAAIAGMSPRRDSPPITESHRKDSPSAALPDESGTSASTQTFFRCPRCTFENHPSLLTCEICGAALLSRPQGTPGHLDYHTARSESPGPLLDNAILFDSNGSESIKLSFRAGGEKIFYERLKGAMTQRKWLLSGAPPPPMVRDFSGHGDSSPGSRSATPETRAVGIAGLERLGLERRKNNQAVISGAFEDLEALMASAKEVIALAESMARHSNDPSTNAVLRESVDALGMTATRDMLGSAGNSDTIYLSELARTLAEWLTDDRRSVLKKEGGIMSLVDLYATFNRANIGVELVRPSDFAKAAKLWEKLSLPVRLRTFKNGLMVVQGADRTDEKTVAQLLYWLRELQYVPPDQEVSFDWHGRGTTAQEAAIHFGWSLGVATEELEMAEERGALCREESVEGLKFWENVFPVFEAEATTIC